MKRFPWEILLALLIGIGLGLVYAWILAPRNVTNTAPNTLRTDFKDQYRSTIAAAYSARGNLPRALARLKLLQDSDPVDALNAQAQRMLAQGESSQAADQIAALAEALQDKTSAQVIPATKTTATPALNALKTATATVLSSSSNMTPVLTETPLTPEATQTQPAVQSTPRPTQTLVPTQGVPFKLTGQDDVCDPNLPEGQLQVIVLNSNRRQLPGMEIDITWQGNSEQFYTGLKPELGNGYADYTMTPDVSYTVQLAAGSDIAAGLTAPTCQTLNGESFSGGIKLTYQQP
jgi:hypothetical protein